ncbi:MAG: tRNA preQ1(34) S-adenosylmethionine ribosyltransferase-isomerase QueA [Pseudomonadota bacterium]|nr:tRNA preQ1(34) S-adenosylmethionine ribosyltransferase-isomerase QueA [Pseudomonadota bacterium]MEC7419739.1 tRNA preQ1(34) S-adenosylmethionine ribosyltransferase-isomerase QueA [Pseudomonadota bacterium]
MLLSDFDYELPQRLIAQHPSHERSASRLMHVHSQGIEHLMFSQLKQLLRPGDLLVLNNTKVVKARLRGVKDTGGAAEVLLERVLADEPDRANLALCQVRVSKPLQSGRRLLFAQASVLCLGREGEFYVLQFPQPVFEFLENFGELPLPPYIERDETAADNLQDLERYQTVFASEPGAVAAPTAGLHFTEDLLGQLQAQGVASTYITLHVGAGTFQPVRVDDVSQHQMHLEHYEIPHQTIAEVKNTQQQGGRIIAVGTTVVRALESSALATGQIQAGAGESRLFITPGFEFKVVQGLITNFHLPRSTLLMLVSAFAGVKIIRDAYAAAIEREYRFFSFGDAMFIDKQGV